MRAGTWKHAALRTKIKQPRSDMTEELIPLVIQGAGFSHYSAIPLLPTGGHGSLLLRPLGSNALLRQDCEPTGNVETCSAQLWQPHLVAVSSRGSIP